MNLQQPSQQKINLVQYLDNKLNYMNWKFLAIAEVLEDKFPGAKNEIARKEFYHRCWSFMMGRAIARKKAPPDQILSVSAANTKVIEALREEAKSFGWMNEFDKAELQVTHEAKEMEGS